MSLPSSKLSSLKYNLESAISTLRSLPFLFTTVIVDEVDQRGDKFYTKGSYKVGIGLTESGTFEAVLDNQLNIISIKISPKT
ncbi:MAG: hypothetical protein H3Z52_10575 [archaeon]|nr:hypothetical protein [archaeon]MCP8321365.1 hypothetical protein [archaeon]